LISACRHVTTPHCKGSVLLAWRNWQTRTAQDRMGRPVEVRVLSRAVTPSYNGVLNPPAPARCWWYFSCLLSAFSSGCPPRFHQLRKSLSAGCCKRAPFTAGAFLLLSSGLSSGCPARFHELGKLSSAGCCKLTFFLCCSSCSSTTAASGSCPTSSGGCRKLRSCCRREVTS
jgi:hypothetical protein